MSEAIPTGFIKLRRDHDDAEVFIRVSVIEAVVAGDDVTATYVHANGTGFYVKASADEVLARMAASKPKLA